MKKPIAMLIVLMLVFSLFCGCGPSETESGLNPNLPADTVEAKYVGSDVPVELLKDGASNYSIVRPSQIEDEELQALGPYLFKGLKSALGCAFPNILDSEADAGNEILIGLTNRPESGYAKEILQSYGGRIND